MINGIQPEIEQPDPVLTKLITDLAAMEKDRDRWRKALLGVFTRESWGSDIHPTNPEECTEEIQKSWVDGYKHQQYLSLRAKRLELVLENAKKALHMMRDGGESPELRALARDILLQIQEQLQK